MAPNFLMGIGSSNNVKLFEIRLDNSNLVLRGHQNESPSVLLQGSLVLCLSQPFKVSDIHLRLTGDAQIRYPLDESSAPGNPKFVSERHRFLHRVWTFVSSGKTHSDVLPPGNYEYPFKHILDGDSPESIEGFHSDTSYVIYRLKATIDRGLLSSNIDIRRKLRVIRTYDMASPEMSCGESLDKVWPDKLGYTISTLTKGVIWGTELQVDLVLIPQLKGLRVGKITIELLEDDAFTAPKTRSFKKGHRNERKVLRDESEYSEDSMIDIEGRGEGYQISRRIPMPKKLSNCMQSTYTDTRGIRIRHKLNFGIKLLNPDGHMSELRCTLPVFVFISPSLPMNDQNELEDQGPQITQSDELGLQAPPTYGDHHHDQLYGDIGINGSMTPVNTSGSNSPFFRSRSHSGDRSPLINVEGEVSARLLQARLNTIQNQMSLRPDRAQTFAPGRTPSFPGTPGPSNLTSTNSDEQSPEGAATHDYFATTRPNAEELLNTRDPGQREVSQGSSASQQSSPIPTPRHIERVEAVDVEDLSRVPSYSTALRAIARIALNEDLPDYNSATSRSPSPQPAIPGQPSTVHARNRIGR